MSRFSVGARVRVADDKTTARVGTVVEVLPGTQRTEGYDDYRVEFTDGTLDILSDLQLSPPFQAQQFQTKNRRMDAKRTK
jgi:hypothetical protein